MDDLFGVTGHPHLSLSGPFKFCMCTTFINPQSVLVAVNYKKICCLEGVFYHYHLIGFPQELSKVVVHPKFRPKC